MIKKLSLILSVTLCSAYATSQRGYLKIPDYFDKTRITYIVDSLIDKQELDEYLVYQNLIEKDSVISYLICRQTGISNVWVIYKEGILLIQPIHASSIFSYKYAAATGAERKEDKLNFKPPLLAGVDSEVVIYYNIKKKTAFYFEYGNNITTYEPLLSKEKYRGEWINLFKKSLH